MRSNPGLKNNPWVCIPYVVGVDVALARQQRFVSHHLSPLVDHVLPRLAVTRTSIPYESHADCHAEYQAGQSGS